MMWPGGTRCAFTSPWYCAAMRPSRTSTSNHPATTRSVSSTSRGVGSSPAISARICRMRSWIASCISGSPADIVFANIDSARRAMPDASAMTSGEESRTSRRSSLRASLSPPSASLESACNRANFGSSSSRGSISALTPSPPFALVSVVAGSYQVGPNEDLRGTVKLEDRGCQGVQALQFPPVLGLLLLPLCLRYLPLRAVCLCDDLRERAGSYVLAQYAAVLRASPAAGVVASSAFSFLPCHGASYRPLQSRGGRKRVTQRRKEAWRGHGWGRPAFCRGSARPPRPRGSRSRGALAPSCRRPPPLRPVLARHLDGRGDLARVSQREQDVLQLPWLEVVRLREAAVEVSEGGE